MGVADYSRNKMSSELDKAQVAASQSASGDTIFGKILNKEIPCTFIYEDEQVSNFC